MVYVSQYSDLYLPIDRIALDTVSKTGGFPVDQIFCGSVLDYLGRLRMLSDAQNRYIYPFFR